MGSRQQSHILEAVKATFSVFRLMEGMPSLSLESIFVGPELFGAGQGYRNTDTCMGWPPPTRERGICQIDGSAGEIGIPNKVCRLV